ncbi:hypothetical protein Tdes44962_MAKER00469 [Teratosphaeria destructans]|uniref:Uncharacterized protein n=1 Tax=Teratosphaeria destructans TaxID=418781 RepID=A0A9W7W1D1_9PEZI|nr:hypothetical protein Tdes44962_MAKER00469 [Teratosphaeria destructans]
MYSFILAVASLAVTANALDGIVVPDTIAADTSFNATFENGNSDLYRVYLAAALAGATGPTCYLMNSTDLTSPVNLSIPASVGPSASYYSIAVADITTSQGATYSNRFNFTGGTGNYTDYENHLGGAAFWNADDLPCSSYECARQCAQASYPDDLTDTTAYDTMKSCILKCPGVSRDADANGPVSNTVSGTSQTLTAAEAIITLSNGDALTAVETTVTTGKSKITEAIVGSVTLTLGGAAATVSNEVLSFASSGLVEGSTSTVAFTTAAMTTFVTASAASAASSSTSSAAAPGGSEMAFAGLAGLAGLAAFLL